MLNKIYSYFSQSTPPPAPPMGPVARPLPQVKNPLAEESQGVTTQRAVADLTSLIKEDYVQIPEGALAGPALPPGFEKAKPAVQNPGLLGAAKQGMSKMVSSPQAVLPAAIIAGWVVSQATPVGPLFSLTSALGLAYQALPTSKATDDLVFSAGTAAIAGPATGLATLAYARGTDLPGDVWGAVSPALPPRVANTLEAGAAGLQKVAKAASEIPGDMYAAATGQETEGDDEFQFIDERDVAGAPADVDNRTFAQRYQYEMGPTFKKVRQNVVKGAQVTATVALGPVSPAATAMTSVLMKNPKHAKERASALVGGVVTAAYGVKAGILSTLSLKAVSPLRRAFNWVRSK